jgi:outer membrane protein assembly factor BamB
MEERMNWKRTAFTALVALIVLVGMVGCPKKPPAKPNAPGGAAQTWVNKTETYKLYTTAKGDIIYEVNWGDATIKTDTVKAGVETNVSHAWATAAVYKVKARALLAADETKASEWSGETQVTVSPNGVPAIVALIAPGYTVVDGVVTCRVTARDPERDSFKVKIAWGDGRDTTSSNLFGDSASPVTAVFTHQYRNLGTCWIKATAKDSKEGASAPESSQIVIGEAGGLLWSYVTPEAAAFMTSPVVAFNGTDSVAYVTSDNEDEPSLYSIRLTNGTKTDDAYPRYNSSEEKFIFANHPAFNPNTQHLLISSTECALYGFDVGLHRKWNWPDSIEGEEIFNPAVNQDKVYVVCFDTMLAYVIDYPDNFAFQRLLHIPKILVDPPTIDAQGNVYVGTSGGVLCKVSAAADIILWSAPLEASTSAEIYPPAIGTDGKLYCGSSEYNLFAVDPADGHASWTVPLSGVPQRPAVGQSAIFVGTDKDTFYALDMSGNILWKKGVDASISTTPIVTVAPAGGNAYVYAQNEEDKLFCFDASNGNVIWTYSLDSTFSGGGHKPRPRRLEGDFAPSPSITPSGNILMIGNGSDVPNCGLFCIKGYPTRPLDNGAPWPKWQHDIFNTGKK